MLPTPPAAPFPVTIFPAFTEPPALLARGTIRIIHRGEVTYANNVPPGRTLLELLREDLQITSAKEGCGEGDCGACTVVLGDANASGGMRYRAVNACIRLAHSVDGMVLWTAADIANADGSLHPAQQALLDHHGSQCGFCTPGFVMSMFAMYHAPTLPTACGSLPPEGALRLRSGEASPAAPAGEEGAPTLPTACGSLPPEGALRLRSGEASPAAPAGEEGAPTLPTACGSLPPEGALRLRSGEASPAAPAAEEADSAPRCARSITREQAQEALSGNLCRCTGYRPILEAAVAMHDLLRVRIDEAPLLLKMEQLNQYRRAETADFAYKTPRTLPELLRLRAAHPDAQLVAGCTDVGLWITKQHREFGHIIDLTRVAELQTVHRDADGTITIGAAVSLTDAFAVLAVDRPELGSFIRRFAGLPVRNSGTLGGNIAGGSPIGDSMPLLIALAATIVLASSAGQRRLPLEKLYTGYRQSVMTADEVLAFIRIPPPQPGGLLRVYKISKRYDDDISAVCLAVHLVIDGGVVVQASIGAGGVAAVPARAVKTEAALRGQPWTQATVRAAMVVLRAEFQPLSDMRASSAYRTEVLGNLLQRYWLESQGMAHINLATFTLEDAA